MEINSATIMTNEEVLLFLNAFDLDEWADFKPKDVVATLNNLASEPGQEVLRLRAYQLECLSCGESFVFRGHNLLDALCGCGSLQLKRR
jgi:hypothetical protein